MTMAVSTGRMDFFFFLGSALATGSFDFLSFFLDAGALSLPPSFNSVFESASIMAALESSNPSVNQILILFEAFLIISEIAMAARIQATGARTSMSLIMTQEK